MTSECGPGLVVVVCWSGFDRTVGLAAGRGWAGVSCEVTTCWSGLGRTTGLVPWVLAAAAGTVAAIELSARATAAVVLMWWLECIFVPPVEPSAACDRIG